MGSSQARPALKTVAIPTAAKAARGVELLMEILERKHDAPPMECIPELELIVRESTAAPRLRA